MPPLNVLMKQLDGRIYSDLLGEEHNNFFWNYIGKYMLICVLWIKKSVCSCFLSFVLILPFKGAPMRLKEPLVFI